MKISDIDRIQQAGLISPEQRSAIVAHFKLDKETNKLLAIFSIIGGVLVSAGIILLISSNWQEIPHFIKLAGGLALMLGAHYGGMQLRREDRHPIVGEALHLIGSAMFLANIALVGQIYHLSSRPPNTILLWLAGIGALPWLLRSKAQHILTLCVFGLWLGLELNQEDSLIYFGGDARQFMFYAILGIAFAGLGMLLRRSKFPEFGPATEKFGLLVTHIAAYPLAIGAYYASDKVNSGAWIIAGVVSALAIVLLLLSVRDEKLIPETQWRWVWAVALMGVLALAWVGLAFKSEFNWNETRYFGMHWIAIPALFGFCLLQAQVGLLRRSPWLVNVAITFIGVYVITAYFELFGTMQTTGLMFVISGVLLIGLAVFLERKRRALLKRMQPTPAV
ncbi:MAG TPA: DUF2157 domain-containing protein [Verrucomicrobiae bacterium]|jgi:uncharacterized membrane protein|nr:DUF2157 domain-containing protein [Verrucomicrobiae bacterium]